MSALATSRGIGVSPDVPLPHEGGYRTPHNDFSAVITWESHPDLMALEVLKGYEDLLPQKLPETYIVETQTRKYFYFKR
jgi:hypothetical protein